MVRLTITKELLRDNHIVVMPTGAIWSFKREGRPLKVTYNRTDGYKQTALSLWVNGKSHRVNVKVHRLVILCHGPEQPSEAHEVNHIDGKKWNNHIDNLEWVTSSENTIHYHQVIKNKC